MVKIYYGWVVVLCCFYGQLAISGALLSMGVFYSSWVEDFNSSRGLTSWVVATSVAVGNLIGPVADSLVSKFGHRVVIMMGAFISSSAFFLSAFATSIYWLLVLIGLLGGSGFGLVFLPSNSIITLYFYKRRSLALGFVLCGTGLGGFLYPPCLAWLEDRLHWRGSLVIMSGFMLNVVVCGALIRPVVSHKDSNKPINISHSKKSLQPKSDLVHSVSSVDDQSVQNSPSSIGGIKERDVDSQIETAGSFANPPDLVKTQYIHSKTCNDNIPNEIKFSEAETKWVQVETATSENVRAEFETRFTHLTQRREDIGNLRRISKELDSLTFQLKDETPITIALREESLRDCENVHSQAIKYHGGSWTLQYSCSLHKDCTANVCSNMSINCLENNTAIPNNTDLTTDPAPSSDFEDFHPPNEPNIRSSQIMVILRLLKNPYFATFLLSNFLACSTFLMPSVYLTDRAIENGVEKSEAAIAMAMFGAGGLFGRVAFGALKSLKSNVLDSMNIVAICLVVCGVSTSLSTLCGANAVLHGVYGFTFGAFAGGFVSLSPITLVELLGETMLSTSFGLTMMFRALGMVLGTPIPGWIYDGSGSYTVSFIIHGIVIGVSGLILVALKVALVRSKRRDDADASDTGNRGALNKAFQGSMNTLTPEDSTSNCY